MTTDAQGEEKGYCRSDEEACSGIVQSTKPCPRKCLDAQGSSGGAQPQRDVDPKDATPAEVLGENGAYYRTECAGKGKIRTEPSLKSSPFSWRNHFADKCLRQGHQAASAKTLQRASTNQNGESRSNCARNRTGDKQAKGPDQHALAPESVSHAAVQRSSDSRGEEICSDHPGEIGKSAERSRNRRKGRGDNGLIERSQKHRRRDVKKRRSKLLSLFLSR